MVSKKAIADMEKTIEEMTLQELVATRDGLNARITTKQAEERDKFIADMQSRATQLGFDLGEMFGRAPRQRRSGGTGERASPKPKYTDGRGNFWSGRGREPRWITSAIAEGRAKNKEEFLIKE